MSPSRPRPRRLAGLGLAALLALSVGLGACGSDDDGDSVREIGADGSASGSGSPGGSASGSGAASASGSGSGSGLSQDEVAGTSDDPLVNQAVEDYHAYVVAEVEALVADTKVFTDAVRAGDVEAAKAAYAPSRQHWEAIEPIAGLIEDIDVAVDARVDDFEGPDDPEWTGWHKLEHQLWETGDISDSAGLADQLDADLATLQEEVADLEITPLTVARGSQELIEEVSEGKITGEEDRYSHTDLWDFAANVEGSKEAITLLIPALEEVDPDLVTEIEDGFAAVEAGLEPYREGEGWASYEELTDDDIDTLKAALAGLSETLSEVPAALELG